MFCFTNILNIFFSFVTCSMHKNPHQNAGNGIKETLFFKISLGSMPPDPPRGSGAFGASGANSCPPPPQKCLSPYAHVSNHFNFTKSLSIFSFYTLKGNQVTKFNREIYLIFFISVLLRETFSTKSMNCLSAILNKFLNPLTMF